MAGEGVCIILISADQNMWGRDKTSLKVPDICMKSAMKYPGAKNEISIEIT